MAIISRSKSAGRTATMSLPLRGAVAATPRSSRSRNRSRALSQGGRSWPRAEAFDGALDLERLFAWKASDKGASELPLSELFRHLPVAVLKARFEGA